MLCVNSVQYILSATQTHASEISTNDLFLMKVDETFKDVSKLEAENGAAARIEDEWISYYRQARALVV